MSQKTCEFPFGGYSQLQATENPVESIPVTGNKKPSQRKWRVVARW